MSPLYPSWIEIPVTHMERTLRFYRGVFDLTDTPVFEELVSIIAVLLPSDKRAHAPGASLVKSPLHRSADGGAIVNFHVDTHHALDIAVQRVTELGGKVDTAIVSMDDGVRYVNVLDCEGNRIALSSHEAPAEDVAE